MATSFMQKTPLKRLKNSRRNVVSNNFGGVIGIPIDRDGGLLSEIVLRFQVSVACAVAPTPGAFDPRQVIERINLRSNTGDVIKSLSGQQAYDMARLTENHSTPKLVPGAGGGAVATADFSLELHQEFDGAIFDEAGSMKSVDLSKLDLEIVLASQAKMETIAFVGATFAAVPALSVTVDPELYARPGMALDPSAGTHDHFLTSRENSGTTTGQFTIELDGNNFSRFIGLHVDDVSAGADAAAPSDAIMGTVKITQGANILVDTDFASLRHSTEQKRGLDVAGFACIDFGDQNTAWPELNNAPVFLQYEIVSGAPAWRVQVTQDYARKR